MSIEIKQKIKEVADDFGMPAKNLIEIVGKFYDKPKSSSQNLSEEQLNVVFDYLTQTHQIASLEEVFAVAPAPKTPESRRTSRSPLHPHPHRSRASRSRASSPRRVRSRISPVRREASTTIITARRSSKISARSLTSARSRRISSRVRSSPSRSSRRPRARMRRTMHSSRQSSRSPSASVSAA